MGTRHKYKWRSITMYNERQKLAFINDHTTNKTTVYTFTRLFERLEKFESEWDVDISQQNEELITPAVQSIAGVKPQSAIAIVRNLQQYVKWCKENGIDTSDAIFNIKIDTTEKVRRNMIASPLHLKNKMDQIFDSSYEETIDIIYRSYFWLIFSGLKREEAIQIQKEDVHLEEMVIKFNGYIYPIYRESIDDLRMACILDKFKSKHRLHKELRNRSDGNLILRGCGNALPISLLTFHKMITLRLTRQRGRVKDSIDAANLTFPPQHIYLSGIYYRMFENERSGIPVDFNALAKIKVDELISEKKAVLSKRKTYNMLVTQNAKLLAEDYEAWKYAFRI